MIMIDLYVTIIIIFFQSVSGIQTDRESLQLLPSALPRLLYCGLTPRAPLCNPPCIPLCVHPPVSTCVYTPRAPPCGTGCADAYISLGHLSAATGSLCLKCTTTSLCTNTLIRTKTKTNTKHKNKKHTLTLTKMIMPESFQQNPSNESHLDIRYLPEILPQYFCEPKKNFCISEDDNDEALANKNQ